MSSTRAGSHRNRAGGLGPGRELLGQGRGLGLEPGQAGGRQEARRPACCSSWGGGLEGRAPTAVNELRHQETMCADPAFPIEPPPSHTPQQAYYRTVQSMLDEREREARAREAGKGH